MSKQKVPINPLSAKRVKECRLENGWSQEELASIAKISKQTVWKVEKMKVGLTEATADALARAFRIHTDYLLGIESYKTIKERSEMTQKNMLDRKQGFLTYLLSCGVKFEKVSEDDSDNLYKLSILTDDFYLTDEGMDTLEKNMHSYVFSHVLTRFGCCGIIAEKHEHKKVNYREINTREHIKKDHSIN